MVGGRDAELVALREHERVNAVNGLGDGGDAHLVCMAMEDVEGDAGEQSVTHSGLLREVVLGGELGAFAVPRAPLVNDEFDAEARTVARSFGTAPVAAFHASTMTLSMRLPRVSRS